MSYEKIKKGFKIVTSSDIFNNMVDYAEAGAVKGVYLGFPELKNNYSMALGNCTDWTGFPRSGKTQILMEFLMVTAEWYGWKHLLYFPDVGNEKEIIADLIHKKTGKTFDKKFKNHITQSEIARELPWICEHFKILTKRDLKAKLSPYEFWDLAVEMKESDGIKTACIDSWKDMRHDTHLFGRDDKYLEDVLSYRNAVAETHDLHFHTIIHPIKTDKDSAGNRKPPTPYDLKGGTEWFNSGKCMLTGHRHNNAGNDVELYINKIKPRSVGETGSVILTFDPVRFRYYWMDDGKKTFASLEYKKPEQTKRNERAQNLEFNSQDIAEEEDEIPF